MPLGAILFPSIRSMIARRTWAARRRRRSPVRAAPAAPAPSCCTRASRGAGPAAAAAAAAVEEGGSSRWQLYVSVSGGSDRMVGGGQRGQAAASCLPGQRNASSRHACSRLWQHQAPHPPPPIPHPSNTRTCCTQGCWKMAAMLRRCAGEATRIFFSRSLQSTEMAGESGMT